MKQTLIILLSIISTDCYSQSDKIFSHTDYTVQFPAKWTLDTSRRFANAVFLFSPLEDSTDKFSENVNVMEQDLKGQNIDLATYRSLSDQQFAELGEKGKLIASRIEKSSNGERYFGEYEFTLNDSQLHIKSICYIKGDTAYLITFTSRPDTFEKFKDTGTKILESFKLR